MADRWCDVSFNQLPSKMLWPEWGFPRGQYRLIWGSAIDSTAFAHRNNMRSAHMKTGSYGVPVESVSLVTLRDQAWKWVDNIPPDDENDDWVDAERLFLTEPMLWAYCSAYEQRSSRHRLAIYTGVPWWTTHVPDSERAKYKDWPLIIAGYPFDTPPGVPPPMDAISVARRSNPPIGKEPAIPPPWTQYAGWQHTGQGSKPGYDKLLDMGIYRVNPGGTVPPVVDTTKLSIEKEAKSILELVS